jgi:hypothetical protein
MVALTPEQIADFRNDIADTNEAFGTDEIQRLYTRAGTYEGAVLLGIDQLIADASKLYTYRMNTTAEEREQVVDHLAKHLRPIWVERAAKVEKKQTTRIVRLTGIGNPRREKPYEGDCDA